MQKMTQWVKTVTLICGMTMVFTSCTSQIDNPAPSPAPSPALPKSYDLVVDEYKEVILDEMIWINIANTLQDQGETFTIESPKPDAQLTIHYYRPDNAGQDVTPVVYYCHGGGYLMGNATMYGNDFREMANSLGATVFSVEYTLAIDASYTYHIELDEASMSMNMLMSCMWTPTRLLSWAKAQAAD